MAEKRPGPVKRRTAQSDEQFRHIFSHLPDPTVLIDEKGGVVDLNDAYANVLGVKKEDLLGKSFLQFVPMAEAIKERVMIEFIKELREQKFNQFETLISTSSGASVWAKINASYTVYKGKDICIATLHDISDRRRIEDGLRKSGEKLRSIFQSVSDGIIVIDMEGVVNEVNQRALQITGLASGREALGKKFATLIEMEADKLQQLLRSTVRLGTMRGIEMEARRKDGTQFYIEVSASLLRTIEEEPQAYIIVLRDITGRRIAEERVKASEERLRDLFDNANDLIQLVDPEGKFIYVNRKWMERLKYSPEEVANLNISDVIHPDNLAAFMEMLHKISRGEMVDKIETIFITSTGQNVYVEGNASARFESGKYTASRGIFRDITDRKYAEEQYQRVVDNVPVGIYIVQDGRFRFVNPEFERITGYTAGELIGKESLSLIYAEDQNVVRDDAVRMLKGGHVVPHEFRMIHKDGKIRRAIETVVSIEYEGRRATLGNFMDITERKEAEEKLRESQERFAEIARMLPIGVFETNERGHYTYFNQHIMKATGYTFEELNGTSLWRMVAPEDREKMIAETVRTVMNGVPMVAAEHKIMRKDGSTYPVIAYSTPIIKEGKVIGARGLTVDVSQLKQMEQELKNKVQELEQANERLKELDKLKDNFLSTVSHELRTPLTSIKSFAEILLNYEEDRATQKEFLGIINEESDRLTRLINDFLDLSKIQSGRMQWQTTEVSISWAIERAINATSALIQKTGLELTEDIQPDLPVVLSDKDRLVQVITNLLSNAQKFTPSGGNIGISARLRQGDGTPANPDAIVVAVSDSGIGIAPENHERIFEKFNQVGEVLRDRPKGTGLGLPISREIIEHYGGKIWVESELGKGSTFLFTIPVTVKPALLETAPATAIPDLTTEGKKTILVVDDEANIRRFIEHELTSRGHNVIEASGGREAIDLARKYHPNLITMDIVMPDLDGFDVTAVLKNDPRTKDIPILIVSVIEDKSKAFILGANDYITKPFSIDLLLEHVNRLLQGTQKTILVVDDDRSLVKSLEFELQKRGFSTTAAYNGKEALEAVERCLPNLVLLDIKMPEMDGYEVIKALKNNPKTAGLRVIIMTGVEIDGGRVKALSIGADEYFTKSGGFGKLFEAVERILSTRA